MIKFYCDECGKEIFKEWKTSELVETPLEDVAKYTICSDCQIKIGLKEARGVQCMDL